MQNKKQGIKTLYSLHSYSKTTSETEWAYSKYPGNVLINIYFYLLERQGKTETNRDLLSAESLPKCLQHLGLGKTEARNLELNWGLSLGSKDPSS